MPSLFTKIINGDLPCHKVAESEDFLAFFDINPNAVGHTLCVPKKEVNKLFDLDENTYKNLMLFSRKVALALRQVVACKRVGMSVIGLEVPHVHVHLIPLNHMDEMRFEQKVKMNDEEFSALAKKVSYAFSKI